MSQAFIPAAFIRGGSSKGVFFHAKDLPGDRAAIDPILLGVLGSPDPYGRQLDGMGGGISSLSKGVIIGPPTHPEADVDYTFAQVAVDRPVVDWKGNCGNLSSAVGPFAVDEGLVRVADGEALVRIHQVNTRKIIEARFPVRDGRAEVRGDFAIAGVAGTGARIRLDFLSPGGSQTPALLPSGRRGRCAGGAGLRAAAGDPGGCGEPGGLRRCAGSGADRGREPGRDRGAARPDGAARPHPADRRGGDGAGGDAGGGGAGQPAHRHRRWADGGPDLDGQVLDPAGHDVTVRMLSMERPHRAVPMTGAMGLAVACRIEGSIPHALATRGVRPEEIRVAHPSGMLTVGAEVRRATTAGRPTARWSSAPSGG